MSTPSGVTTESIAGRTLIAEKALKNLVAGVAAEVLGVPVGKVDITISDDHGLLALTVRSPLGDCKAKGTLLERAEAARQQICEMTAELSGRRVGNCLLELDGLQRTKRGRVL